MRSLRAALGAILICGLTMAGPAFALPFIGKKQPPAAPKTPTAPTPAKPAQTPAPAAPGAALDVKGFRSATFGMTPAQVKAAAASDFGAAAKVAEGSNAADGTQFVLVSVEHLDPGPGTAQVGYVFGATSKTLTAVNVVWSTVAEPTEQQRTAMVQAGQQLAAYFQQGPAPAKTGGLATFGTNGLVLYSAVDKKDSGVEVMVDGVEYQRTGGDKPLASPPPKGPATLRVSYTQNVDKPDIKAIKPGSF